MTHEEKLEFLDRKWKATLSNGYWEEVERLAKLKELLIRIKLYLIIILKFHLVQKLVILFWSMQRIISFLLWIDTAFINI